MTLLGPLLGIKALSEIRARPGTAGAGIAVAGIVIGLVITIMWGSVLLLWDRSIRQPLIHGPIAELTAGMQGDITAFKRGFTGEGATVEDQVAEAFVSEIGARYGMVINMSQDETRESPETEWGAISPVVPYLMQFEDAFVSGEAEFVILDDRRDGIIAKWRWIIIHDPEHGDLAYPPDARRMRDRTLEQITVPDAARETDSNSTTGSEDHTNASEDPTE